MISPLSEYKNPYFCTPINRNQKQDTLDTTNEQKNLAYLLEIARQIQNSLRNEKDQYQKKMNYKQKQYISNAEHHQKMIVELTKRNEQASRENNQLRLKLNQTLRHLKQSQMKIQLLNNKIRSVSHEITQKEAVIKYLQNKNQDKNQYQPKKIIDSSFNNISVCLDQSLSSFRSKDLSFAKLKQTKMKFQDFANSSSQFLKQPKQMTSLKNKTKRIRTESSYQIKQNRNQDNFKYSGKTALHEFLNNNLWTNSNDKTMAKKTRHSNSNWMLQSTKQAADPINQRKSLNFNNSTYFYKKSEHSYMPNQLSLNVKKSLN